MSDTRYNGWNNYETWNAKLWIDNDQGSQEHWQSRAADCLTDVEGDKDDAARMLADELESSSDENAPEASGMYADMLRAALDAIDWREIADSMIDDEFGDWREANPVEADEEIDK